jgi:hypothetical protein
MPEREEVTGDWRIVYNDQFAEIIQVIKSGRVR